MSDCRLLQSWDLPACGLRVVTSTYGTATVSLSASTGYRHDGFLDDLVTALEAAFPGSTWTAEIVGVGTTSTTIGQGRIVYTVDAGTLSFDFSHAGSTISRPLLGWASAFSSATTPAASLTSPYVHRFGWYPSRPPWDPRAVRLAQDSILELSRSRVAARDHVVSYERLRLVTEYVRDARVVQDAGADSLRAADALLTVGDPYASLEAFVRDHVETDSRIYYDRSNAGTGLEGPYIITDQAFAESPTESGWCTRDPTAFAWNVQFPAESVAQ